MTNTTSTPAFQLYDIVSVQGFQRVHEPVACIAATSREEALATYHRNPAAYLYPQSGGEIVEGLPLAAFETHYRRFTGPFTVGTPGSATVEIHEGLASAVAALQFVGMGPEASVKCAQGWTVALPQS